MDPGNCARKRYETYIITCPSSRQHFLPILVPPSLCILLPGTYSLVTPSQRIKTVLGPGTSVPRSSATFPHHTRSRHPSLPLPIVSYRYWHGHHILSSVSSTMSSPNLQFHLVHTTKYQCLHICSCHNFILHLHLTQQAEDLVWFMVKTSHLVRDKTFIKKITPLEVP